MTSRSRRLALLVLAGALLGAGPPAGCGQNEAVKAYEAWAAEACKCEGSPDAAACVAKVRAKGEELAKRFRDATGTEKDAKALATAGVRGQDCLAKATKLPEATPPTPAARCLPAMA